MSINHIKFEILELKERNMSFIIEGMDIPIANTMRRIIIAEVPCMAIDDVIIIENTSPMKDEVLAHRLGLLPLKTDLNSYIRQDECTCNSELGCNKCRVILTLEAEGPRTVYSGELRSEDPAIIPISDRVPILKLANRQRIRLEAYARLGIGQEHAKWQAVSVCSYSYYPKIEINCKKINSCKKCIDSCPKQILKINKGKVNVTSIERCDLCKECENICDLKLIKVSYSEDKIIFIIESTGALSPIQIFQEANRILNNKSENFIESLKMVLDNEKKNN